MSTQAPAIPPRPSRSPQQQQQQQQEQAPPPTSNPDVPNIPPRPSKRRERSMSPLRHNYAPSPLNEKPGMSRTISHEQVQRPSSVTIPSLGQEGIEYEDLNVGNHSDSHHQAPTETRNVGSDLKLHAPRPSLPSSSANAKVAGVTRTDSRQAAAAGIGAVASPGTDESQERPSRSLHFGARGARVESSTASPDHHQPLHAVDEHGIPEIGKRVPMDPNAGDVQAPSPAPYQLDHGPQRPGRSQHRTLSSRDASLPPGSYGLHGHGVHHNDKFEKAWYEKHPDEYAKEEQNEHTPALGTPRPEGALSSDDLNKLVRGSAAAGSGMGTSPAVTGTPEEELAYIASDEYTHRMASPAPDRSTRPAVESPLRQVSHPATADTDSKREKAPEDTGVIHVDEPYHSSHHPDGFAQSPSEKLTRQPTEDEAEEEPILAADEVRPEYAFQHPAVSPTLEKGDSFEHETRSCPTSSNHSRSGSRPTSLHRRPGLARFSSCEQEQEDIYTPLEDVDEYEPLFPEDDKNKKPVSTAERFKQRPDSLKHRFPSQDIWEDSPNSLQLHATVTTPDIPTSETFETSEQEAFRRSQTTSVDPHEVASHILESEDHKEDHEDKDNKRPSLSGHRFPSRDVWEDAPDSQKLVTTVGTPEEASESPEVPPKPNIPPRPQRRPQESPPVDLSTKPGTSPTEKRQPPTIPDRPKPQIPVRPAKRSPEEAKEAKESKESKESPEVPAKPKPPVPGRPGGSRIAALKAGFLTDLNSRLQVGPQGPKPQGKKEDPPAEKKPLQDARKGRARGPARRKPAPAPAPAATPTESTDTKPAAIPEVKITDAWNVWQVDEVGKLVVGDKDSGADKEKPEPTQHKPAQLEPPQPEQAEPGQAKPEPVQPDVPPMATELSKNVAGDLTDPLPSPDTVEAPEVELKKPEPAEPEPAKEHIEPELAIEPATKPDETRTPPDELTSEQIQTQEEEIKERSESTPEIKLELAAENLAASADGKRQSDGDLPVIE